MMNSTCNRNLWGYPCNIWDMDMPLGAISIAEHVHRAAERYPIYVALHTDHCLAKMKNYDGVLKIEGDVGNKEKYDPRSYLKLGEAALAERVKQAATDLRSVGTTLFGSGD